MQCEWKFLKLFLSINQILYYEKCGLTELKNMDAFTGHIYHIIVIGMTYLVYFKDLPYPLILNTLSRVRSKRKSKYQPWSSTDFCMYSILIFKEEIDIYLAHSYHMKVCKRMRKLYF